MSFIFAATLSALEVAYTGNGGLACGVPLLSDALSAAASRRVAKFSRGSWAQTWPAGGTMFALYVLARGPSSRSDFDAGAPAGLPHPRQNSRRVALGEALETSWA